MSRNDTTAPAVSSDAVREAFATAPGDFGALTVSGTLSGDGLDLEVFVASDPTWQTRVRVTDPTSDRLPDYARADVRDDDPRGPYLPVGHPVLATLRTQIVAAARTHAEELRGHISTGEVHDSRAVHQWDAAPDGTIAYGGYVT